MLLSLWISLFGYSVSNTQVVTTEYENVELAIKREFGSEWCLMESIFRAESGLVPRKEGDNGNSIGVSQINIPAHGGKIPGKTIDEKKEWLKNFQNNLKLGKKIRDKSGLNAWTAYWNGNYLYFYNKNCR